MSRRVNALRVRLQQEREARELAAWGSDDSSDPPPCARCGAWIDHPPAAQCSWCRTASPSALALVAATLAPPAVVPAAAPAPAPAPSGVKLTRRLTAAQARRVREMVEDEGASRAEALAWVRSMGDRS